MNIFPLRIDLMVQTFNIPYLLLTPILLSVSLLEFLLVGIVLSVGVTLPVGGTLPLFRFVLVWGCSNGQGYQSICCHPVNRI